MGDVIDKYKTEENQNMATKARRHLRIILGAMLVIMIVVIGVNGFTFSLIRKPENARLAQMIDGWTRVYKPILYDQQKPQILALGASWVRDAFDPVTIDQQFGKQLFNMGISGGTSYEAQRLLQSALIHHEPEHVILNLNSFGDTSEAQQARFGFDETLLNIDAYGEPQNFVAIRRWYSALFSGAALAYGAKVVNAWWARENGEDFEAYIEAYDHFAFDKWNATFDYLKAQAEGAQPDLRPPFPRKRESIPSSLNRFSQVVDNLCQRNISVHAYGTGHPILISTCRAQISNEMKVYDLLSEKKEMCPAGVTFHAFEYPNAVTMEGVWGLRGESHFFRSDGHPRPTQGTLMFAQMLGLDVPQSSQPFMQDFGTDLIKLNRKDAQQWLENRKARCDGIWDGAALSRTKQISAAISAQ